MTRIPILDCVPGSITLRPQQVEALLFIEKNYDLFDFFCLNLPVGAGKSWVATTYNNWIDQNNLGKTADITPTKLLQDQYTKDFTWIPDLKGMNNYACRQAAKEGDTCADRKRASGDGKLCGGPECCTYMAARTDASQARTAIFNFHSYLFNKMWESKDHLVIDEGHNTRNFLEGLYTLNLWGCELGFDGTVKTDVETIRTILDTQWKTVKNEITEALARRLGKDIVDELEEIRQQLESVMEGLAEFGNDILITKKEELYKKRKYFQRDMSEFKDSMQTVVRIKPLKVSTIAHWALWREEIKKVLFLSATISKTDMAELGIEPNQVACFTSSSPIPADRRKFIVWPKVDMSYQKQKANIPEAVESIRLIAEKNKDTKGVIHCTYEVARLLEKHLIDGRYMFHATANKNDVYHRFRESKKPSILVACGMAEGIDLPDDFARWQIILKVQYPSLGDDVWAWKCSNNHRAYQWETIKTIIQQSGRICRGPNDKGFTYMLDSSFLKLWERTKNTDMWPNWFREAMVFVNVAEKGKKDE